MINHYKVLETLAGSVDSGSFLPVVLEPLLRCVARVDGGEILHQLISGKHPIIVSISRVATCSNHPFTLW